RGCGSSCPSTCSQIPSAVQCSYHVLVCGDEREILALATVDLVHHGGVSAQPIGALRALLCAPAKPRLDRGLSHDRDLSGAAHRELVAVHEDAQLVGCDVVASAHALTCGPISEGETISPRSIAPATIWSVDCASANACSMAAMCSDRRLA